MVRWVVGVLGASLLAHGAPESAASVAVSSGQGVLSARDATSVRAVAVSGKANPYILSSLLPLGVANGCVIDAAMTASSTLV